MSLRRYLVVLILMLPIAAAAQTSGAVEPFDTTPPGWEFGPGSQVADGVLRVGAGGPVFRPGIEPEPDFSVRVRFDEETIAGVMYAAGGSGAYALFLAPGRVELVREAEQWSMLYAGEAPIEPGEWFDVSIRVDGSAHFVQVAGTGFETTDPDPHRPGEIAFRAEGAGSVEFDDLTVVAGAVGPTTPSTSAVTAPTAEGGSWVRTGGPLGGLGYDVRMDPRDPNRMYVTDAFAGVFISEDGGATWFPSNEGITTRVGNSGDAIPVFSLTIDPNDPDTLWAGTQHLRGIFKSDDRGATWTEKDNGVIEFEGITFRGFGVEPGNSDVVYAAGELAPWLITDDPPQGIEFDMTGGVVYKTRDGGENWTLVWRGDNLARYVWIDPADTDIVYVSTGIFDREAANSEPLSRQPGGVGVLKSIDGGATWTQINRGLTNLYVGSLSVHPEDPNVLLAGTGNNTYHEDSAVFLSTNGGSDWVKTDSDGATAVDFADSDPSIAYAASINYVRRSDDGGMTWETVAGPEWGPPGVRAGFPIDLQVDPRDPDRIFANNYGGGNFLSTDGGRTWSVASTGYTGAQVRDVVVHPEQAGSVVAAARSGMFRSNDGGGEWGGLLGEGVAMLEFNAVAIDPSDGTHLLAGTNWDGALLRTNDSGTSWTRVVESLGPGHGWRCLEFAPSDPNVVYGGIGAFHSAGAFAGDLPAGGIWKSPDGGGSWSEANDEASAGAHVATIAIHPNDASALFAASPTDGLLYSQDGGSRWVHVEGLPDRGALSVAFDPLNPLTVLAGFQGGVYRSADGGETWGLQPAGLPPEARISDIAFDPIDPNHVFVADIFSGVYQSTDGGQTWLVHNEGLRTRAANALAISADGRHLYAATEGEGVFRLDISGSPPPAATPPVAGEETQDGEPTPQTTTPTGTATVTEPSSPAAADTTTTELESPSAAIVLVVAVLLALGAAGWAIARRRRPG